MPDKKMVVLSESHKMLNKLLETKQEALPKDFNKARFLQNCMTVLQDTKDIEKCQPISVARTMLKGAFLGLDFFNRECYAIPYGGSLQFQTDYKGEIKLAKKYSFNPIKDIYAKVVHEGDDFQESIKDGQQTIDFKPIPFNNGEIIGAFAVCLFQDGSMLYETMTKQEIEGIRNNFSKAKNSPAWVKTPGEMYKKTVLRRLCKLIELDFDSIESKKIYNETSDFEFQDESKHEVSNFDKDDSNIIEADAEVQDDVHKNPEEGE
jgi:recombination protein RecT